ncbi:hypothetical protein CTEN210_09792 [Chaetoceros tenuissimus]|uniref:Uncharacterized protein n=1 Tax=Chaetoceros tenuissimus TaxID=426638 RepID=A0AAD3CY64_9STRA|nr:hypothetical protein CTEN210_09792 [Chaetoceros tenuissimus]
MSARKKMRLEDRSSGSDGKILEPSATMNDLPSEVMKSIFSFVGKGNYCFIGPVSKDFCFNYLTMDVIEDKFAHRMDYIQAIGKNKITTAEAASSSSEMAEYCFFKAPKDFQKQFVRKAISKGKLDIVGLGYAMGVDVNELTLYSYGFGEIAKKGNLEMFQLLLEKGADLKGWSKSIIRDAAGNNQLQLLKWLNRNNMCQDIYTRSMIFFEATKNGNVQMFKWAQKIFNCRKPTDTIGFAGTTLMDHTAKSDGLELIEYFRSQEISWGQHTLRTAAKIGNIAFLEYLLENGHSNEDPWICISAVEIPDHQMSLKVLKWLHEHNFPWEDRVCTMAAEKGNLKALKYLRSNNCPWNVNCLINAVRNHHYEMVKYCLENGCPMDDSVICRYAIDDADHDRVLKMLKLLREFSVPWNRISCTNYAAEHGNIEALKWIRSQGAVIVEDTCVFAAMSGRIETLKWLTSIGCPLSKRTFLEAKTSAIFKYCIENDVPFAEGLYQHAIDVLPDPIPIIKLLRDSGYPWHQSACSKAVSNGDIKLLRWLRFSGCPWNESVCNEAVKNDYLDILKYAHENGCPWSKETYAYCFSEDGLDAEYYDFPNPDDIECSEEIFEYLQEHNCPQPAQSDWNVP